MATVFVVDLPGRKSRMVSDALRDHGDNVRAFLAIAVMREAVMPPGAECARATVLIDLQHVRHLGDYPAGRRCRRCPHNDLEPVRMQAVHGSQQPAEVDVAGCRLDSAPGELTDADPGDSGLRHAASVTLPELLGPLFRIVADTERRLHRPPASRVARASLRQADAPGERLPRSRPQLKPVAPVSGSNPVCT